MGSRLTGASDAGGWAKIAILDHCLASSHVVDVATPSVIHTCARSWHCGMLVIFIAGSNKWHCLLITGDRLRSVYDKKPHCYAEDNITEFNCTHL